MRMCSWAGQLFDLVHPDRDISSVLIARICKEIPCLRCIACMKALDDGMMCRSIYVKRIQKVTQLSVDSTAEFNKARPVPETHLVTFSAHQTKRVTESVPKSAMAENAI